MIERERLRDAVIEAANKLVEAHNDFWHTGLSEPTREIRHRWEEATFGVVYAARAIQEHERKAGGQ